MLPNVEHVLNRADKHVAEVRERYEESLFVQQVPGPLGAAIRDAISGYRAALEFVANAVANKHGAPGQNIYWPNAKSPKDFVQVFDRNLPGVRVTQPDIAATFERFQSYQPGYEWVDALVSLYRGNQHHDLTPQTRTERVRHVAVGQGGSVVDWDPAHVHMGGGVFIHGQQIDPATQTTPDTFRVVYVDWLFAGLNVSAWGTLTAIKAGIREVVQEVCSVSDL